MNDVSTIEKPTKLARFVGEVLPPSRREEIRRALPAHVPIDRFERNLANALMNQPKLMECQPGEVFREVAKIAALGLVMDAQLGEAYLIASNTGPQARIGYRGLIKLARQSGDLSLIYAHEVYSNDMIECVLGDDKRLTHKPDLFGDRGDVIGYYAVMKFKDGDTDFEPMNRKQIDEIRDKSDGYRAFKNGKIKSTPWADAYDQMALKTVLRRLLKRAPMSPDLAAAIRMEDEAEHSEYMRDVTPPPPPPKGIKAAPKVEQVENRTQTVTETIDNETGEVLENDDPPPPPSPPPPPPAAKASPPPPPPAEKTKPAEAKGEAQFDYVAWRENAKAEFAKATSENDLILVWDRVTKPVAKLLDGPQKTEMSRIYEEHETRIKVAPKAADPAAGPTEGELLVRTILAQLSAAQSEEDVDKLYEDVVAVAREEGRLSNADLNEKIDPAFNAALESFKAPPPPPPKTAAVDPSTPEGTEAIERATKAGKFAAAKGSPREVPDAFARDPHLSKAWLHGFDANTAKG